MTCYLSIYLSIYLFIYLSIYLFIYLSIYLSIYLQEEVLSIPPLVTRSRLGGGVEGGAGVGAGSQGHSLEDTLNKSRSLNDLR